ncbi:Capsular polysaccharide type 8 biosynthesis protein cap8A [Solibacillus isronensis B3W22]|uniref:Capsular polysaccharide type 8 biosynthesis protein cap8A n=1 Tax=Solibacillus isronensis B3W22 TaxID=1224748 RepID=K1KW94_9BACL|nr:Wzz/FepE/Etk N-terminal domain-containing protein [Solibacillus isronensis]AMO84788.1 capsular biosynthesis protein [Solibacillus silvestris]EKB46771.1 Capsular polysaccharide type 8 biosynthesis protein cap8A [Solibacillus isronensis B3W22]
MEESLSLQEITNILKKRLWLIIILTITSIGITTGISFYALTPTYQAQTQILVNQNNSSEGVYSWQTTETDLRLINTYNVIITSPVILTPVIEALNLNLTPSQLTHQISISNENDSKVVTINVENPNPSKAVEISNTVAEVFKEQIPQLMSVDNISILSAAKMSENPIPVKPNKKLNIAIGGLIGLILGIGLAFLLEFLDMSIKGEQDVEDYLGLPVIGIVDLIKEEKQNRFSFNPRKARRS